MFVEKKKKKPIIMAQGKANFSKILKDMPKETSFEYTIKYTSQYLPDWAENIKNRIGKSEYKSLSRYDNETKKDVNKWLKITKNIKKIENDGVAISIRDNSVLIGLIKSNTTMLIKDIPFAKLMKDLFETKYNNSEFVKDEN